MADQNSLAQRLNLSPLMLIVTLLLVGVMLHTLFTLLVDQFWTQAGGASISALSSREDLEPNEIRLMKSLLVLAQVFWFAFPALVGAWLLGGQKQLMGLRLPKPAYLLVLALLLPTLALPLVQATFIPPEAFKLLPGLEGLESWARSQEAAVERQLMQFLAQDLWLNILVIALVPAVCEELFFRGLLQPLAVKRFGPWLGVLVVAVGFSLFHLQAYGFFSRMLLGLLLGLTVVFTGSLWMSILAHLANNLAAVVLGTLAVQGKISEAWLDSRAVNGWPWVLGSLVLTAALLYAVKRLAQTPAPASEEIDYGLAYEGLAAENPPEEPHP